MPGDIYDWRSGKDSEALERERKGRFGPTPAELAARREREVQRDAERGAEVVGQTVSAAAAALRAQQDAERGELLANYKEAMWTGDADAAAKAAAAMGLTPADVEHDERGMAEMQHYYAAKEAHDNLRAEHAKLTAQLAKVEDEIQRRTAALAAERDELQLALHKLARTGGFLVGPVASIVDELAFTYPRVCANMKGNEDVE